MTRQPSLLQSNVLPPKFVEAWDRLEIQTGKRPVVEVEAVHCRMGRWTIAMKVNGKRVAMVNREDLDAAAQEAWNLSPHT